MRGIRDVPQPGPVGRHDAQAGLLPRRVEPVYNERDAGRRLSRQHGGIEPGMEFVGEDADSLTGRASVSATGLPSADGGYSFNVFPNDGKQLDQDTYGTGTIDHAFRDNWHATVRYGLVRKREESERVVSGRQSATTSDLGAGIYYGNNVTVLGANGTSTSGQALMNYGTSTVGAIYPYSLAISRRIATTSTPRRATQHGPHLGVIGGLSLRGRTRHGGRACLRIPARASSARTTTIRPRRRPVQEPLLLHGGRRRGEEPALRHGGNATRGRIVVCGAARPGRCSRHKR
jgi:hypothetical protein